MNTAGLFKPLSLYGQVVVDLKRHVELIDDKIRDLDEKKQQLIKEKERLLKTTTIWDENRMTPSFGVETALKGLDELEMYDPVGSGPALSSLSTDTNSLTAGSFFSTNSLPAASALNGFGNMQVEFSNRDPILRWSCPEDRVETDNDKLRRAELLYTRKKYDECLVIFKELASRNSAIARNYLGVMAEEGKGVEKDLKTAMMYYQLAAAAGYGEALNNLGYLYAQGRGVEKNLAQAQKFYKLAADQGNMRGQCNLGWMYYKGNGVELDYEKAFALFELSANQGYALSMNHLGIMYQNGHGIPKNDKKAFEYFSMAAEKGSSNGKHNVGYLYEHGIGTNKDLDKAYKFYKMAANEGHVKAKEAFKRLKSFYARTV